jgi:hypothetical protein
MLRPRRIRGANAIYGLFLFFAEHRTLISTMLCATAVFTAVPMFRARRPAGAVGMIVAAAVLAIANTLVSGNLVNALVYERGPISPASDARTCAALAQPVLRANGDGASQSRPEERPEYAGAVQAYLADGCGGDGRDLRTLRQAPTPTSGARS